MKVLILCKRFYTNKDLLEDRFGRLYHLPVELSKHQIAVSVLALDYRNSIPCLSESMGVRFQSIPIRFSNIPLAIIGLYRLAKENSPNIIIASGDSHIGYMGKVLANRIGCRYIFDVYDYYPAFSGNRIPGMKWMFMEAVKGADTVLCASDVLANKLRPKNVNCVVIPNGVDTSIFRPFEQKLARNELGISQNEFVIGYFGSIMPSRGPILIDACKLLRVKYPHLRLLLAGQLDGVDVNFSWVSYLGNRKQSEIPELIAACDIVTIPYANDPFNNHSGACKIPEYLACGKPVVATDVADHSQYFNDVPASICLPTPEAMARTIDEQYRLNQIVCLPRHLQWTEVGKKLYGYLSG